MMRGVHSKLSQIFGFVMIGIVSIMIFSFASLTDAYAQVKKNSAIDVYYKGQYIQSMTYKQFEALVNGADKYKELLLAEENKRIVLQLQDNPWVIDKDKGYFETKIYIMWLDKNKKVIKKMQIDAQLKIPTDKKLYKKWVAVYRDAAAYSFPVMVLLIILLAIL